MNPVSVWATRGPLDVFQYWGAHGQMGNCIFKLLASREWDISNSF